MTKNKLRSSAEVESDLRSVNPSLVRIYTLAEAVDIAISNLQADIRVRLESFTSAQIFGADPNAIAYELSTASTEHGFQRMAGLLAIKSEIFTHPLLAEATAILQPLRAEHAAALNREREITAELAAAKRELESAEAAAREEMETKVAADPRVKKAAEALAGIKRLGEPL